MALFFYRETKGLSLEEASVIYDFKRNEARDHVREMFQEDDKPEAKHIEEQEDDVKEPVAKMA